MHLAGEALVRWAEQSAVVFGWGIAVQKLLGTR